MTLYCGIDLHSNINFVCVIDGNKKLGSGLTIDMSIVRPDPCDW